VTYPLSKIRPNPFRNIDRYPINREKVEKLKQSIGRTDFWDNIVARTKDETVEIAYGHHRLVALRELFPPDNEVNLIVRDLDDAAMLHIMADENMQEWGLNQNAVIVETVRAVRDFLRPGAVKVSSGGRPPESNSITAITAFLGWPEGRVEDAIGIINAEESGLLKPEDTTDLTLKQATVMRQSVARIENPKTRREAIKRVRQEIHRPSKERTGTRGIPDLVRQIRDEIEPPVIAQKVPDTIAKGLYSDIADYFHKVLNVNGASMTRFELIRLIAENRNAIQLSASVRPWADQIADALDAMAVEAMRGAAMLRSGIDEHALMGDKP
jgi:hypothetical protein